MRGGRFYSRQMGNLIFKILCENFSVVCRGAEGVVWKGGDEKLTISDRGSDG